jgi:signal transduction histidine kinase
MHVLGRTFRGGRPVVVGCLTLACAAFVAAPWVFAFSQGAKQWWSNLGWTLAALAATLSCALAARASRVPGDRLAWTLFAAGAGSWFAAQLVWDWLELVEGIAAPFPSWGDVGYVGSALVWLAGMLVYGRDARRADVTLVQICNLGGALCGVAIVVLIALFDGIATTRLTSFATAVALAYPILSLTAALFGGVCLFFYAWGQKRLVFLLVFLGVVANSVVNVAYCNYTLRSAYATGASVDFLWVVAFAFFVWAAYEHVRGAHRTARQDALDKLLAPFETLFPVAALLVVLGVTFFSFDRLDGRILPYVIVLGACAALFRVVHAWASLRAEVRLREEAERAAAMLKQHERRLRDAVEEAAEASRAKSAFLASMSHDLRTPLNAILGFSEIMRDARMGPLPAVYRDYGATIHGAGSHLLHIVNDVLDLAKIEADRLELDFEPVDLGRLLGDCARMVRTLAERKGLALAIDLPPSLPTVSADERRLIQVVLNLLGNAVKFTNAGGTVRLAASRDGESVLVRIEDTGIGMETAEIPLALEPFRQVDPLVSRRSEGSGLGLPIASRLTRLHGGTLAIESEPGRGTTVTLRLPAARALAAA